MQNFEVVIIGGGHAGIEAAWACQNLGVKTALISLEIESIGRMSCNPAIGGLAKGQMVRDVDAMGGLMGRLADKAAIHFKMLNRSKGPAVWGPRAQMDMDLYSQLAQAQLQMCPNLTLIEGELTSINPGGESRFQLELHDESRLGAEALIITSGTFLGAKMFTGLSATEGGRIGERAAAKLASHIKSMGIKTRRLKTGTPSRIDRESIDFSQTQIQHPDANPIPFSLMTDFPLNNSALCWITHTSEITHDILRQGFDQSPMFTGKIQGLGPRYCPSIEDKVDRFSDKSSHQLFLEPEGLHNNRIYVNGFSSSLPEEIQERALKTVPGLGQCRILKFGYAVEYDAVDATDLHPTLEHKEQAGIYFAGQVNGTSGYEEAAAQGLVAGANAALKILGREPFLLDRAESYIGVMINDLVMTTLEEPYRMFTSRSEYRLFLRQDNSEFRLLEKARKFGLISDKHLEKYGKMRGRYNHLRVDLEKTKLSPEQVNPLLEKRGAARVMESLAACKVLKRPEIHLADLIPHLGTYTPPVYQEELYLEAEIKYAGFYERQKNEIEKVQKMYAMPIPAHLNYSNLDSIRLEARQKLGAQKPMTVGLASQIPGVTPADISALIYHVTHQAALGTS